MCNPPRRHAPQSPLDRRARKASVTIALLCATALVWGCAGSPGRDSAGPQVVAHADLGHDHIPSPQFPHPPYNSNPGTSGPHTPYTAPWGVSKVSIAPEVFIHNLEHGGIVIGYRCPKGCPEQVSELTKWAEKYPMVIVTPIATLDAPVVLAAWVHTLSLERLDEPGRRAMQAFFDEFHGVDHHPVGAHGHSAPPEPNLPFPASGPGPE
ncbi:MAG: DUF3105 domain-containing protein [Nitrospirota bacterium]|nr:DUF3105 domain-containing protein [Nitrospirota bacterium]